MHVINQMPDFPVKQTAKEITMKSKQVGEKERRKGFKVNAEIGAMRLISESN